VKELKTLILGTTAALVSASLAHAADGLNKGDADKIFQSCVTIANKTPSPIRGTPGTKMWCAVLDREGETLLIKATDTGESPGPHLLSDAWRARIEIAEAKAYTALSVTATTPQSTAKRLVCSPAQIVIAAVEHRVVLAI
jgi:uncharacterized protein GlcG (DUF336 family)